MIRATMTAGTFNTLRGTNSEIPSRESGMLRVRDFAVVFMVFMQRSSWSRFSFGRGALARSTLLTLLALLAGCQGEVTMDLATELPADPNVTQVVANIRGLEFSTSSGGTETLEFRTSEPINFISLADDNGVFRLFTSEELSEGNYTGVRLLFDEDRLDDAFVSLANGTQFPLNVADAEPAPLSFNVEDRESSNESFTLVMDLRQALSFNDSDREYTLTPVMRAVETADMSRINGNVNVTCPAGGSLGIGAVYLFQGRDVTPDDIDGTGVEPFATSPIFTPQINTFVYSLRYLPAGDYTLAVTCSGNDEDPLEDQDLRFRNSVNVTLDDRETITRDLP